MMAAPLKKGLTAYQLTMIAAYATLVGLLGLQHEQSLLIFLKASGLAGLASLALMVFQELVPRAAKESIVFWRLQDRLPGCRAFSVFAVRDDRIDQAVLARHLPNGPLTARDENALWYKWLKQVEADEGIADNHRRYLILRDCAVLTLALAVVSPVVSLLLAEIWPTGFVLTVAVLATYVALAQAARLAGERLVSNVIAAKLARI